MPNTVQRWAVSVSPSFNRLPNGPRVVGPNARGVAHVVKRCESLGSRAGVILNRVERGEGSLVFFLSDPFRRGELGLPQDEI